MKRTIKISAKFEGVLPTGSYANMRPGYTAEEQFEIECDSNHEVNTIMFERQKELQDICYKNFEGDAEKARIIKLQNDIKNFRIYDNPITGKKYPSVTSVISYDKNFFINDEELRQYAAQGTIIDAEVKNYIKTGKWVSGRELEGCAAEWFILTQGSKQLATDGWDFIGFLAKYPISDLKVIERAYFNEEYQYAGMPDLTGIYLGMPTLVSLKRTDQGVDALIQEAAYAKCEGLEHIKQMMVVELKAEQDGGNKCGFSKPTVNTSIDKYFELFAYKRKQFKKIYGI